MLATEIFTNKHTQTMNIKTRFLTIAACLIAIAAPSSVFAAKGANKGKGKGKANAADKAARPGMLLKTYDTDKNGAIDGSEIKALRAAFDSDKTGPLKKLDGNNDGTLDDSEVAAIKGHAGKGKGGAAKGGKRKKNKAV